MVISITSLVKFANGIENKIEKKQCALNALKVYDNFGGDIYCGSATYIDPNFSKEIVRAFHYWNVFIDYNLDDTSHPCEIQLVDILNFKKNEPLTYLSHHGNKCTMQQIDEIREVFTIN
jgi:hypothetical protein